MPVNGRSIVVNEMNVWKSECKCGFWQTPLQKCWTLINDFPRNECWFNFCLVYEPFTHIDPSMELIVYQQLLNWTVQVQIYRRDMEMERVVQMKLKAERWIHHFKIVYYWLAWLCTTVLCEDNRRTGLNGTSNKWIGTLLTVQVDIR